MTVFMQVSCVRALTSDQEKSKEEADDVSWLHFPLVTGTSSIVSDNETGTIIHSLSLRCRHKFKCPSTARLRLLSSFGVWCYTVYVTRDQPRGNTATSTNLFIFLKD